MLEKDRFTIEDRRALNRELGLPDDPDIIAYDAGNFIQAHTNETYQNFVPESKPEKVKMALHPNIFINRFFEEIYDTPPPESMKEAVHEFYTDFYYWRFSVANEYEHQNTAAGLEAAVIVNNLTLQNVRDFATNRAVSLANERNTYQAGSAEYNEFNTRADTWSMYAGIARGAYLHDLYLQRKSTG